jgi:predicted dehydrogenase
MCVRVLYSASIVVGALLLASGLTAIGQESNGMRDVRLMTLDPGHFHAALVQKAMYPGVAPRVDVYAPLGPDLLGHLTRISGYNSRAEAPTAWQLEVHTGANYVERMLSEHPGNVVVISGRNRVKIERILASVRAGLNVLADKPWVLRSENLPQLDTALAEADTRGLVAYDIMTERFEITSILQREFVNDPEVFGNRVPGTEDAPAVYMESVHYLMKVVSGAPNIRPVWFFDTAEQGEGLNDIGTHLVDLVHWTLFPGQGIDRRDLQVQAAQRWPTRITEADFRRVTASGGFPAALSRDVSNGALEYYCNTLVSYTVRGTHVKLNVIWDWEAPAGSGDRHYAVYRGGRSRVEVRQGNADNYRTELYIVPNVPGDKATVLDAVRRRVETLSAQYPGLGVEDRGAEVRITIAAPLRVDHEGHFAQVTRNFLSYLGNRSSLPAWERANMLAKYYVTTMGTELSRKSPAQAAPRLAP